MMTNFKAPWKAFKADGKHVSDDTWNAMKRGGGTSCSAPIKNSRGVTIALVVAHARSYADLADIVPVCRLIAAAPALLDALQMAKHIVANEGTDAQMKQVFEAIEKATGEAA